MTSKDVYSVAFEALAAAVEAPTKDAAIIACRNVLDGLDAVALQRIAGCIAIEFAWGALPSVVGACLPERDRAQPILEGLWVVLMGRWVERVRVRLNHVVSRPARPASPVAPLATVSSLSIRRRGRQGEGVSHV